MENVINTEKDKLNKLSRDWDGITKIIPYGFGWEASRCIDKLMADFEVPFIIDNDPAKRYSKYKGVDIIPWEEAKDKVGKYKILITTRYRQFQKISALLEKDGFHLDSEYSWIKNFIPEWYWNNKHKCCLYTVDFTVSAICDFRCKNCNMFMPYYNERVEHDFSYYKENLDLFFQVVDYVCYIGFIGGEPLLCPCLNEVIEYAATQYNGRVGNFTIHSNGSVMPDDSLIELIKKYNITVAISDYGEQSPCRGKMQDTIKKLRSNDVYCDVRADLEWRDVGFPANPNNFTGDELRKHMELCSADWRGLNDGKFYYCNIAWSAEKAGLIKLEKDDYLDLQELISQDVEGKHRLLLHSMGYFPKGYMSFCVQCGGCGIDNKQLVTPGVQLDG